jgi:hypothetical protein
MAVAGSFYFNESARQVAIEQASNIRNNWFSRIADAGFNLLAEMLLVINGSFSLHSLTLRLVLIS